MAWNDNPTEEERVAWFVRLLRECQSPLAAELLEKAGTNLNILTLEGKQRLLGGIWREMERAYSTRLGTQQAFNFVHRLTTRAILTRYNEHIPFIDSSLRDPMRYFHSFDKANTLLRLAGGKALAAEVRLSLVAFANLLLKEGMMDEVVDQLLAFVRAGRDYANEASVKAFVDSEYLVDGKNILLSEERGKAVKHLLLRRIRNAIAHGRFVLDPRNGVVELRDVNRQNPAEVYEAHLTLDGFHAVTVEIYLRVSVATAYFTWLLIWTMTGADVLDVFDLATYKVRDDILPHEP